MKKRFTAAALVAAMSAPAMAGGLLTNTNQHAAFLRNPARDAVTSIEGVNTNPAGVAFMPQGLHLSVTWQAAFQKRLMDVENPLFGLNSREQGRVSRRFEGKSVVPVIPSFQGAYVFDDKWSVSAQFAIGSGGGKCEFAEGLPMFEELVGGLVQTGEEGKSYGLTQHLTGEQYFYGLQLGGTYRLTDNLSVFGGVRGVLANCSYSGGIADVEVEGVPAAGYYQALSARAGAAAAQYLQAGMAREAEQATQMAASAAMAGAMLGQPLTLDCRQKGFGLTPIIGVDWKLGRLNLAAKYEFRTRMNLKNTSNNSANLEAVGTMAPAVAVYADGARVRSDIPSLLTVGAQYDILPRLRAMAGFHYYWDRKAKGTPILKGDNTYEILAGVEWEITDRLLLGIGVQRTQYGFATEDISDISFNASSTTVCIGGAWRFNPNLKLNVGYMHGFYDNEEFTKTPGTRYAYTRRNDVIGASLDLSL